MDPPSSRWRVLFFLALLASPPLLFASTLEPRSLEELIRGADLIVRGTVRAVTAGAAPRSTTVVIAVLERWKGPRLSTLRLLLPRGTEGGITQEVPGLPAFRVEEDVILFAVREPRGEYQVLGGRQGKFSVTADPQTGNPVVEDLAGTRTDLAQFLRHLGTLIKAAP